MSPTFVPASRLQSRLRMTIDGPAGAGKSFTALRFAHVLKNGSGKIAAIDTEHGSLSKYVGESPDGIPWNFDVMELNSFSPDAYSDGITLAGKAGYSVLIIDSLSHAWEGVGGALEIKDRYGSGWTDWRKVSPLHNRMVDAILASPCHVITTMRSRMEHVQEVDSNTGKIIVRKVGMAPIQRPGMEYEFDIVCDVDWAHVLRVSKTRCSAIADMTVDKPGPGFMVPVIEWLQKGSTKPITLDDLTAQYEVEAILAANNGAIPATQSELAAVMAALKG